MGEVSTPSAGSGDGRAQRRALQRAGTREASDLLLAVLRDGRWMPRAWVRFAALAGMRSMDAARAKPRSFAQVTALHLPFLALGRRHRVWVVTSWVMAVTHLGMLGDRDGLGVANTLTLVRANLPAVERLLDPVTPVLSLITDFVDGKIARGPGRITAFGAQADFVADAAFWTWFVARHDPSRAALIATLAAWSVPLVGLTVTAAARGRVIDLPRSVWVRPAAAVEVVIGTRAVMRWARSARGAVSRRRG